MRRSLLVVVLGLVGIVRPALAQSCQGPALGSGMNDIVRALTVFDDGTGPALYTGGNFTTAGNGLANHVAKWDGTGWSTLGNGVDRAVLGLAVFDDGTGPALYAGGNFTTAGGGPANFIAKWDGTQWYPLGSGMNDIVRALAVFDDGTGPALYAGGDFLTAGGVAANNVAKWDGTQWSALGTGMGPQDSGVFALAVFDDGTGPALDAGGGFSTAGGVPANNIAKWDGTQWSALGSGVNGGALALTVFDDGSGPALYAGGPFGGVPASGIAKWNGTQWSALGSGTNAPVRAMTTGVDFGIGPALVVGGSFTMAGGMPAGYAAVWNGAQWFALGGPSDWPSDIVRTLTVFDDGTGPALYAGGDFIIAGGVVVNYIARGCP